MAPQSQPTIPGRERDGMVGQAGKWYMHAVQPIRGRVRFAGFALTATGQENGRGASASWGRYTRW